jgi:hypothetical protein
MVARDSEQFCHLRQEHGLVVSVGFSPRLASQYCFLRRTKESAKHLLSKLYPASNRPKNSYVTLFTYPQSVENLYPRGDCAEQKKLRSAMENTTAYTERLSQLEDILHKLDAIYGIKNGDIDSYFDTLMARRCHDLPYPEYNGLSLTEEEVSNIARFEDFRLLFLHQGEGSRAKRYSQVGAANIFAELIPRLRSGSSSSHKFFLYSGHDTTLSLILGALNVSNFSWPPYASNLVFELWRDHGTTFVRVIYNGQPLTTQDNWCDLSKCPLSTFEAYFKDVIDMDLSLIC